MSKSRQEWKVGLFVFIGLALLAALLLQFSKGLSLFRSTYDIYLEAPNVGGLQKDAAVLMAGVQVGTVKDIRLAPQGTNVSITLRIYGDFVIHKDARFEMEQAGFLGDQYVAIVPTENKLPPFEDGDRARAEAPFNLQQFTRSATGFIGRVDETLKKLNDALEDVRKILLNPQTLTNLSITAGNLRKFSERAVSTMENVDMLVATNGPALNTTISNLALFSDELDDFAREFRGLISTNREGLTRTVNNIESSSESLKAVMHNLEGGKGVAGNLLTDEQLAAKASEIVNNLSITTSNLNRLGLWRILWRPKTPKEHPPEGSNKPLTSPKQTGK